MHTPTQLVPTGAYSALCGARRRRECAAYRLPQVRELRLRLEPVAPDTFGGTGEQLQRAAAAGGVINHRGEGSSLMTFISNRRVVATIVAASCIAVPASASADSLPSTYKSDAAQSGGDAGNRADAKLAYPPSGFTGGDIAQSERTAKSTYPPSGFNGGDNPADRVNAPTAAPMTIEVVRPERTIVRDVDEALPLILSGSALLLVLAGLGFTLTRNGIVPRLGRSD